MEKERILADLAHLQELEVRSTRRQVDLTEMTLLGEKCQEMKMDMIKLKTEEEAVKGQIKKLIGQEHEVSSALTKVLSIKDLS